MNHLVVQQSCNCSQSTGARTFSSVPALSASWLLYFISADHLERRMIRAQSTLGSPALEYTWENQAAVAVEVKLLHWCCTISSNPNTELKASKPGPFCLVRVLFCDEVEAGISLL